MRLLTDLHKIFADAEPTRSRPRPFCRLVDMEDAPWGDLRGRPLDSRGLSRRLKPYGITPRVYASAIQRRGDTAGRHHDAWSRYCPLSVPRSESATSATGATTTHLVADVAGVADSGSACTADEYAARERMTETGTEASHVTAAALEFEADSVAEHHDHANIADRPAVHPNGAGQITEVDAALYLGVSKSLLRKWRREEKGPPWVRLGQIRYPLTGLDEYIELSMRRASR